MLARARRLARSDHAAENLLGLTDPTLTWRDLEQFVADAPLPVLVKGIQTAADATPGAPSTGVAGIVVSNHGGRQLDTVAPTARMLPRDRRCGRRPRARSWSTAASAAAPTSRRAIALGARAVLVGRPALYGLAPTASAACGVC